MNAERILPRPLHNDQRMAEKGHTRLLPPSHGTRVQATHPTSRFGIHLPHPIFVAHEAGSNSVGRKHNAQQGHASEAEPAPWSQQAVACRSAGGGHR